MGNKNKTQCTQKIISLAHPKSAAVPDFTVRKKSCIEGKDINDGCTDTEGYEKSR